MAGNLKIYMHASIILLYFISQNYASAYTLLREIFYPFLKGDDSMGVKEAVVARFMEILKERNMRANELANLSGITPSTVYSMFDGRRKEITINVIKKLCDGLDMTLGEFFGAPIFDELEQEIR